MRWRTLRSVRLAVVGEGAVDDRRRGREICRGDEVPDRIASVLGRIHELDTGAGTAPVTSVELTIWQCAIRPLTTTERLPASV